jgi:CheY-like chemotaxis protein
MTNEFPMAATGHQSSPERLLRDAVASIAVAAYQRGTGLSLHVDSRVPERLELGGRGLAAALRRSLKRSFEAGGARGFGLALWRDEGDRPGLLLEICRGPDAGPGPRLPLAGLWAGAFGSAVSPSGAGRRADGTESVLVALPAALPPASKPERGGLAQRVLVVRDILLDPDRCRSSLARLGIDASFTASASAALEMAREAAAAGRPAEHVVIDARLAAGGITVLADAIRADARLSGARLTLVTDRRTAGPAGEGHGPFDSVVRLPLPWSWLTEGLAGVLPQPTRAERPAAEAAPAAIPDLAGRRILIAEDTATNQVLLRALLAPTGAEVASVADGQAAIDEHARRPAGLILMDLQMPGMNGVAAARQIRATEAAGVRVPVVALTAHAKPADRRRAMEAGMDAYLVKPIVVAEFYELVARLLGARPAGGPAG